MMLYAWVLLCMFEARSSSEGTFYAAHSMGVNPKNAIPQKLHANVDGTRLRPAPL